MVKIKLEYLHSFFNVIEIVIIPLYFVMFGLIIFRWISTGGNIREFKENPKAYVSFQYSAQADTMLQGVIGVVAFLLNIKFLKFFQFSKHFYTVGLIMKSFFYPLLGFFVSFFIIFFMFAAVANLRFGAQNENYRTFMRSFLTQFMHLLGSTNFAETQEASYLFGPIYYVSFTLFVLFVTFNVFLWRN